ncbi:hypothetical protein [Candidatus Wolbachia massiliensis]|uniref:Uncharacterized protein n=1 Tax=Candidatus Wolbachia massiliensis TaxID=1845000 RepID=A0A7L7YRR5_9RICK|nr:hypothetical protein [Candidatus Wolbachia massiliensis]QOD37981.1 hypothetical protein ID128_03995 [Candidatus Wolbachia massiliensis]
MNEQSFETLLSTIRASNDLNKDNVINKIAEQLKKDDPHTYKKWSDSQFSIDYKFTDQFTLLCIAAKCDLKKIVNFSRKRS